MSDLPGAQRAFAEALAAALVTDLREAPPRGPLLRIVVRWFMEDDPGYFTVHCLGAKEKRGIHRSDKWSPLEWPNDAREFERTDRVAADPDVRQRARELAELYEGVLDEEDTDEDWDGELKTPPAIANAVGLLPGAITDARIPTARGFEIRATHFEGP